MIITWIWGGGGGVRWRQRRGGERLVEGGEGLVEVERGGNSMGVGEGGRGRAGLR